MPAHPIAKSNDTSENHMLSRISRSSGGSLTKTHPWPVRGLNELGARSGDVNWKQTAWRRRGLDG